MSIRIKRSEGFHSTLWSGGTSTELFIFPPKSNYALRNFQFRLSTATIESEESTFTHLPGIFRKLMILEGQIEIFHQNQYSRILHRFDLEEFPGDWITTSKGKCTDFNLMLRGNVKASIKPLSMIENQSLEIKPTVQHNFILVYVLTGKVHIESNEVEINASTGDLVITEAPAPSCFNIKCSETSDLLIAELSNII
jgi:uncharacterized protein